MKNSIRFVAAAVSAATLLFTANAFAATNTIKINGTDAPIPEGMGTVLEKDDRTFVPLRFVSEILNNEVWFLSETQTAGVLSGNILLFVQNGNNILFRIDELTGEQTEIQMDTAAFINPDDNRTYLPIRFLAEALGFTVGWDEATETVSLTKEGWIPPAPPAEETPAEETPAEETPAEETPAEEAPAEEAPAEEAPAAEVPAEEISEV